MEPGKSMDLPIDPPVLPMLAKRIDKLPTGSEWIYEPKWDGFRTLIFRDAKELLIQSRDEKSLNRYFPELLKPLLEQLPKECVLDGEIVIATNGFRAGDVHFGGCCLEPLELQAETSSG